MRGKIFLLDPIQEEETIFSTKDVGGIRHKRLGHYYYQGLLKMQKLKTVRGLLEFEFEFDRL